MTFLTWLKTIFSGEVQTYVYIYIYIYSLRNNETTIIKGADKRCTKVFHTLHFMITRTFYFASWNIMITAWKVSGFGVFLVRIFPHSDWITPNTKTFYAVKGTISIVWDRKDYLIEANKQLVKHKDKEVYLESPNVPSALASTII